MQGRPSIPFGENPDAVPTRFLDDLFPEPVAAIEFAFEFQCYDLLPAAYYQLSRFDINETPRRRRPAWSGPDENPNWSLLRQDELFRYYQGKHKLTKVLSDLAWICEPQDFEECETLIEDFDYDTDDFENSSECRKTFKEMFDFYNELSV